MFASSFVESLRWVRYLKHIHLIQIMTMVPSLECLMINMMDVFGLKKIMVPGVSMGGPPEEAGDNAWLYKHLDT